MVPRELPEQPAPAYPVNDVEAVTRVLARMLERSAKIFRFIVA